MFGMRINPMTIFWIFILGFAALIGAKMFETIVRKANL